LRENSEIQDNRRRPFAMVTKAVLDDETFITKGSDKLVYAVLCSYADNIKGDAYPSINTIAKRACCSEHTVRRSLKKLQELGLILVEPRYTGIGKQTSNRYVLLETPDYFRLGVSRE
jgi:response regulator of citrate/malate metabolism